MRRNHSEKCEINPSNVDNDGEGGSKHCSDIKSRPVTLLLFQIKKSLIPPTCGSNNITTLK